MAQDMSFDVSWAFVVVAWHLPETSVSDIFVTEIVDRLSPFLLSFKMWKTIIRGSSAPPHYFLTTHTTTGITAACFLIQYYVDCARLIARDDLQLHHWREPENLRAEKGKGNGFNQSYLQNILIIQQTHQAVLRSTPPRFSIEYFTSTDKLSK